MKLTQPKTFVASCRVRASDIAVIYDLLQGTKRFQMTTSGLVREAITMLAESIIKARGTVRMGELEALEYLEANGIVASPQSLRGALAQPVEDFEDDVAASIQSVVASLRPPTNGINFADYENNG